MKEIVSKFSLYDILAMVIPGGTILLFVSLHILGNTLIFDTSKASAGITWTIILIVSYLLGLINQCITNQLWKSFRNNPYLLKYALDNAIRKSPECCSKLANIKCYDIDSDLICEICYTAFKYICLIIGLVIGDKLIIVCCNFSVVAQILTTTITIVLMLIITSLPTSDSKCDRHKKIHESYNIAYYYALKNRYSDDIPILEAQVAFLQSMIIPLALLFFIPKRIIKIFFLNIEMCTIYLLLLLIIIGMFFTIYYRQMKIYQRVWEDYEFL